MNKIIGITIAQPGIHGYTPEMGQKKPDAKMEATRAYYGKHYFIDTPLTLKPGRGIDFRKVYTKNDFTPSHYYKVGWNSYMVTNAAFEKLKNQYSISMEFLLD
jgi:hypothetical protein